MFINFKLLLKSYVLIADIALTNDTGPGLPTFGGAAIVVVLVFLRVKNLRI